jgi:uncharacterized membrane protein YkvA (DUF1232 family)
MAAVLGANKVRSATASPLTREIEGLSWTKKVRLVWALSRDKRVPEWTRLIVLAPALYLVSPIDIMPDFIPVLGRIDDAAIFGLAIDLLVRFAPRSVVEEQLARLR